MTETLCAKLDYYNNYFTLSFLVILVLFFKSLILTK